VEIVDRLLSLAERSDEDEEDDKGVGDGSERSPPTGSSALESISSGGDVPSEIAGYELDMNSPINVRWEKDGWRVECSHTGEAWNLKLSDGEDCGVVSAYPSRDEAVEAAERVMSEGVEALREEAADEDGKANVEGCDDGRGEEEAEKGAFEDEIESILEEVDTESIEEVAEALGD
jgi:hypothetical protein